MKNYVLLFVLIGAFAGTMYYGFNHVNDAQSLSAYTIAIFVIGGLFGTVRTAMTQDKRFSALKREEEKKCYNFYRKPSQSKSS